VYAIRRPHFRDDSWGKGKEEWAPDTVFLPHIAPRPMLVGQDGPKCARRSHRNAHAADSLRCQQKRMLTPCPECAHRLWTEVGSIGVFRLVVFLDEEEGSDTYAEQVQRCPGCGLGLYALAIKPSEIAPRR
jgi:hypothetical protein